MSRISIIVILGVGASVMIGIMAVLAAIIGHSFFAISGSDVQPVTPISLVVETAVFTSTATPTGQSAEATATATIAPSVTSAPATTIAVLNTSVQYVQAQTNVNVRSGPGTGYDIIGWVADGQTAKVTGVSSDNGWWRVVCPDDTIGSCWVTASSRYTQPTNGPVVGCTDAATFVTDVTVPDGTVFASRTGFNKTWRIKNNGTCTWTTSYRLVHAGGHLLDAISNNFPLQSNVAPGQTIDLTVSLVSPAAAGAYQSDWKLQNAEGQSFGIGANRSKPFWAKIVVADQTRQNGSISGFVWQDKDHDNVVDGNEMLPNITVTLATGTECRTKLANTKSDGNGRYTFTNLAANSYCLFGTDGTTTVSQSGLVLAANQQLTDVKVTWPPVWPQPTTISGLVYQDANQNGVYDSGETLMGSRLVWLIPGTSCQVQQQPQAVTFSGADGRYTLAGEFNGSYCVGLVNDNGQLDDVIGISVSSGQTVTNINLKSPAATGSISGYVWNDYCLTNEAGDALAGNCVADGNGGHRADGMIQPTETNIPGITILLQRGSCNTDNPVAVPAVTDSTGKYSFNNLQAGTYCVFMNAASPQNGSKLLPGDWTFPARGIWYHQLTLQTGDNAYSVNFGWDYQLQ